jgi:hypothetical protein
MSSERCRRALDALKSDAMPYVIDSVMRANDADNASGRGRRAMGVLLALRDPFADALCVVMYAGRDEFMDGHPYDAMNVDTQFSSWWDYLLMEGEHFAREQMGTKMTLGKYLRMGAYMFRIDTL